MGNFECLFTPYKMCFPLHRLVGSMVPRSAQTSSVCTAMIQAAGKSPDATQGGAQLHSKFRILC